MGRTHPTTCEHGNRVGSDDFHDEPGRCETCDLTFERVAELKRLVKAAANRSEEVRCQIETLHKRDSALRDDIGRYVAELRELTGQEYPLMVHETAPDREARKLPRVVSREPT